MNRPRDAILWDLVREQNRAAQLGGARVHSALAPRQAGATFMTLIWPY
jgi:hypothetical protein